MVVQCVAAAVVTLSVEVHLSELAGLHQLWMALMENPP